MSLIALGLVATHTFKPRQILFGASNGINHQSTARGLGGGGGCSCLARGVCKLPPIDHSLHVLQPAFSTLS